MNKWKVWQRGSKKFDIIEANGPTQALMEYYYNHSDLLNDVTELKTEIVYYHPSLEELT